MTAELELAFEVIAHIRPPTLECPRCRLRSRVPSICGRFGLECPNCRCRFTVDLDPQFLNVKEAP